ncbi:MAG TPA: tannase/feruloyl esterase family alpha/beta hydrolase [Aquabacterium sp.]|nr:tannase/feruloyl esterase family alpha/beta hydrolase [Aquabacterium sp.]HQC99625.1 tannase/feruloyl esterase family alpha/beta hydrolase [Aquabacterium sp.]
MLPKSLPRPHLLACAAAATLLAACAGGPPGAGSKPGGVACGQLASAVKGVAQLDITGTRSEPADDKGHPAHCVVTGRLNDRAGDDGKRYAIGFEMRLPQGWNQRFLHQVNGGNDGVVVPAFGPQAATLPDALARGFAVISSNAGHDGEDPANLATGLVRGNVFGLDRQARRDYGYSATDALWPVAQGLIQAHYGKPPQRNYMAGCSNGGRHGMVAASRQGSRYDGILASAPGFNLPKAAVQHAWDVQAWRSVDPDIRRAFSPADLKLVADKVLARCDALDLLVDGIVADTARCQKAFRLSDLQCQAGKADGCLSAAQVAALTRSWSGPRNSRGQQLYSDWPVDPGIAGAGWRTWKLESSVPPWDRMPIIAVMGAGSLAYLFTTPPTPVRGGSADLLDFLSRFDFDRDAPKIFATDAQFPESPMAVMTPPDAANPLLADFARKGGKLIVLHGVADPVFSVNDTLQWAERLQANLGLAKAGQVARVFPVPGMGHCQGGPATDQVDALGALVDWVEKGQAPDKLIAKVNPANKEVPANWSPQRSRPLCPHPQVMRYAGGDVESAASFRCANP